MEIFEENESMKLSNVVSRSLKNLRILLKPVHSSWMKLVINGLLILFN